MDSLIFGGLKYFTGSCLLFKVSFIFLKVSLRDFVSDIVDILQHLMIEFIYLIFEKLSDLATCRIDLILMLQTIFLYFVQKLYDIVNCIFKDFTQILDSFQMDILLY
jgi:hypothetical protein